MIFKFDNFLNRLVLTCQAVNVLAVIEPDIADIRETSTTVSQLIDISKLLVNSTLQLLMNDDDAFDASFSSSFTCTSNPFTDYYALTKNIDVVDLVYNVIIKA